MSAYYFITIALIIYPILGYSLLKLTVKERDLQKHIIIYLTLFGLLILAACLSHVITISQNLNWFLVTIIYFCISGLIWYYYFHQSKAIKYVGRFLALIVFGLGYLAATAGFFFLMIMSVELSTDQQLWLDKNLMYEERNIGSGPDPSVKLKVIEIYRTVDWLPFLVYRIEKKVYDEWDLPLQKTLQVSYLVGKQQIQLKSSVSGNKVFNWKDSITLGK